MQFKAAALAALALLAAPALGVTLSYDETYDKSSNSLAIVACSDGSHGMLTKGFTTFGSLPHFPNIGGAVAIAGWNDADCGSCWQLTYNGKSINVLAIDHAGAGFNIAKAAMNTLTNGQAVQLGRIDVTAKQVAASVCGL
ncbi:immunomodulatory protein [Epithele typhae]|uniref:immunomodulatory protein n=1 Tax=Epithele typhae TaxID=378194 RepID=UPI002007D690|nr:immunomodulatory protein [Epithele typhae]KAH9918368.1 immunomodulatory protein [Epithele typhae]